MFAGLLDRFMPSRRVAPVPHYTVTRLITAGSLPVEPGSRRRTNTYRIPKADAFLQFRVAFMLDLLNDSWTHRRVELVLRDLLAYTTVREHQVVVRTEEWEGEFIVACNPPEAGTLLIVIPGGRPGT
jgi:hypothetical protein